MKYSEEIIADFKCENCSNNLFIKQVVVRVREDMIRLGKIVGKIYENYTCKNCGKLKHEIIDIEKYKEKSKDE